MHTAPSITSKRHLFLALLGVLVIGSLAFLLWPRSDVPVVEERAQQIAAAVNAADREQLTELLNYDVAADTLLQDATGTTVTFEPGGVVDQGDGSYMVTLTTASGEQLVIYMSYDNGTWGQAAVP